VFRYKSRPFTGGVCAGVEMALEGMKTGGVRRVIIPPELGFGERGATLRPTVHVPGKEGTVPPNATLEYELSLLRVSIPPA
jgi:FKBP-type peptidyl-prolyl cis-trans isomerase